MTNLGRDVNSHEGLLVLMCHDLHSQLLTRLPVHNYTVPTEAVAQHQKWHTWNRLKMIL